MSASRDDRELMLEGSGAPAGTMAEVIESYVICASKDAHLDRHTQRQSVISEILFSKFKPRTLDSSWQGA